MLRQIGDLSRRRENFGFETTLSGRSYLRVLQDLQKQGYLVSLFFLWLPKVDMAIQRVKDRVRLGGHSVEDVDIRRRFERGIRNFSAYREIVNEWQIIDGSITPPVSLAYGQSFIWKCESKELEPILTRMVMGHEK
jgi:predicted ABC-type ATPase